MGSEIWHWYRDKQTDNETELGLKAEQSTYA